MDKPSWVKPTPKIEFKVMNDPLEKCFNLVTRSLESQPATLPLFIYHATLIANYSTFKAIIKLIAVVNSGDKTYPSQAHYLVRTMIDATFTIGAIVQSPEERANQFKRAGYCFLALKIKEETERHDGDDKWRDYLAGQRMALEAMSRTTVLSENEIANPDTIARWPTPGKLIRKKWFDSEDYAVYKDLYETNYGYYSVLSHQSWWGMASGWFGTQQETHWDPGKMESDACARAMICLLMMISEVAIACQVECKHDLAYTWGLLISYFDEAKDYYERRYSILLNPS